MFVWSVNKMWYEVMLMSKQEITKALVEAQIKQWRLEDARNKLD